MLQHWFNSLDLRVNSVKGTHFPHIILNRCDRVIDTYSYLENYVLN